MPARVEGREVCYFLGNISSHVTHALPLQRALGGEVVVLSEEARRRVAQHGVQVRALDDLPRRWRRTGPRFERTDQYLHVPGAARRTLRYLEEHARVVLLYELFDYGRRPLRAPRTIYMGHGNSGKPFFAGRDRVRLVNEHDFVAAPGPYGRLVMIELGIRPEAIVDLGLARTDEVVARRGPSTLTAELRDRVGDVAGRTVFAYVPTWWGPTSVDNVGLELVEQPSESHVLLVRLHPQTPDAVVARYRAAAAGRPNVHLLLDDAPGLGLLDILAAADAVVGDLSSVMVEALLLDKPLVFAGDRDSMAVLTGAHPISRVVEQAPVLRPGAGDLAARLDEALATGIDADVWESTKQQLFFSADGTCVQHIVDFVRSL